MSDPVDVGVVLTTLPYAEMACGAWSSTRTKTMLGRVMRS